MKQLFLLPFLVFCNCLYGQNKLSGTVVVNGKAAEDVNVLIFRASDSAMVKGAIADASGAFLFDGLAPASYFLRTYYPGYRDTTIPVSADMLSVQTPLKINLLPKSDVDLKEVSVTNKKPLIERKSDRLVFNIENSITSMGGDGIDALSKTPGLRVNGDNISIIGKSNVLVMVNDRLLQISGADLTNYLRSIPSDNISAIEVITNPPAKYDAQGNSGLINIRLKKNNKEGWTIGLRANYVQATYPGAGGSAGLDYKKKKLSFHTTLNSYFGSVAPVSNVDVFYPQQWWYQTDNRRDYSKYLSGQAALDYQLSDNSVVGVSYFGSNGLPDMKENINTPIYNLNKTIDSSLRTTAYTNRHTTYQSVDAYYQSKLDTLGKKIVIDGNYSVFSDDRNKPYSTQTFDNTGSPVATSYRQYRNDGEQDGDIFTLKADAELPYEKFSMSFGGKLTVINNISTYDLFNSINNNYFIDSSQSNRFLYRENVQALYANFDKTINKWELQAGLRGELTEIKANSPTLGFSNTSQYFKVFPTFVLNYKINDNNSFSLNYGKRIDRPSYWDLNPFRWYFSQYAYAEGNPYLQPSYNNNLELDYTYKDFLTASVYYSLATNQQDRIVVVSDNSDTQKNVIKNFLTTNSYGANITYIFNKLKWLENNDQLQVYYSQSISSVPETIHRLTGMSANISSSNSIILNKAKSIFGEVSFAYQFAGIDGVDRNSSYYNIDIGMKFRTKNKRFEVSAVVGDIFKTNSPVYSSAVNGIDQVFNNYFDDRRFRITIKYKFGNDQLKTSQHQAGNQEEAGRIK